MRVALVLLACLASCTLIRPPRQVVLDGEVNFRDVGGYKTVDGKRVQWGQVYWSGMLAKLTPRDVETMRRLQVQEVVDFRTDGEIEHAGADRIPEGVRHTRLPISGEGLADQIVEFRKTRDFSLLTPDVNPDIHRLLVQEGKEQYAAVLRAAIDPANRPLVFHCSHGVHRTGTAAAILLSALGVPWKTVRKDYLLSNKYRKRESSRRIKELSKHAKNKQEKKNIRAFYILEPEYIDATRDEILRRYGSMEAYIKDGLGITDAELAALRNALLN